MEVREVSVRTAVLALPGRPEPRRVVVRTYGRDSLLIWANVLLGSLFAALGLRVSIQSEAQLAAKMEADGAAMRRRGYVVASVQTFSLPAIGAPRQAASWYRVTYERTRNSDG